MFLSELLDEARLGSWKRRVVETEKDNEDRNFDRNGRLGGRGQKLRPASGLFPIMPCPVAVRPFSIVGKLGTP